MRILGRGKAKSFFGTAGDCGFGDFIPGVDFHVYFDERGGKGRGVRLVLVCELGGTVRGVCKEIKTDQMYT